jgi:hypothetical protein
MALVSQSRSLTPKTARKRSEEMMTNIFDGGGDPLNPDDGPGGVGGNGPTKPPPPPPPPGG